jgi:signal transduction histidine kinase
MPEQDPKSEDLPSLPEAELLERLAATIDGLGPGAQADRGRALLGELRARREGGRTQGPDSAPGPGDGAPDGLGLAVLDALPAQVAVLDRTGRILCVNRAWRDFARDNGAPIDLARGVGIDYLGACRESPGEVQGEACPVAAGIGEVLAGRLDRFVREYPCHSPERERWFALTAAPLDGSLGGAVVIHFDISERRRAEGEARRVRDAAAQVARANAVGNLASSLVHELAQPLSAASFFSGTGIALLERDGADREKLGRVLAGVDSQVRRAAEILQRLRDFLRKREMRMERAQIDEVVAGSMVLAQWMAAEKKVRLTYAQPAPGLAVRVDALQIEQVLFNLICNAVQAIDRAGAARREVSIALARRPRELEVTVHDTGPGIPIGLYDRLFELFVTAEGPGLGMGLAIGRDIVEAHGGRLWAEPPAGPGAVFHFTLPVTEGGESQ